MGRVLDGHLAPQVVIQRVVEVIGETEQHMDAGALDVSVDNGNAVSCRSQLSREVRRGVALAGTAPEGVDRDDGSHGGPFHGCEELSWRTIREQDLPTPWT